MGHEVNASIVLQRGLRSEMMDTYRQVGMDVEEKLSMVLDTNPSSDGASETYWYWSSIPKPIRQARSDTVKREGFDAVSFNVVNHRWSLGIEWHIDDERDDQTGSLFERASSIGESFGFIDEDVFFQILLGTVDPDNLPVVPVAPDGAAFFATTAGGANRFGVAGGNIVTGGGVATPEAVRTDYYKGIIRMKFFTDDHGRRLWRDFRFGQGITVVYNANNEQNFMRAFLQKDTLSPPTGGANALATVENIVQRRPASLFSTTFITDNDWYMFLNASPKQPVFRQNRQELEDNVGDPTNSDRSRSAFTKTLDFHLRRGYGLALPYGSVQINN